MRLGIVVFVVSAALSSFSPAVLFAQGGTPCPLSVDADGDGVVDDDDFGVFAGAFGGPGPCYDFDQDGDVDDDDFGVFAGQFGIGTSSSAVAPDAALQSLTLYGDFDGDGDVDDDDFGVFAGMWPLDLDGDGQLTDDDFGVFAGNYGAGVGSTSVPEPASAVALAFAAVGLAALRPGRRR